MRMVEPGCESSIPGSNGCLVPDLTDVDPTLKQSASYTPEARHGEIDVANGTGGGVGESFTNLDRATGATTSELDYVECVVR